MMRSKVVGLVAGLVMSVTAVHAQPGGGGFGGFGREMFGQSVSSRDMERYEEYLQLTDEQKDMVQLLFEGYSEQTRALGASVREKMEKVRADFEETRDPAVWEGVRETMEESRASRRKVEETFLADVKAVLTEEQGGRWPELERMMRRDQQLPRGLMSGERVNVLQLVEDAKLPEETRSTISPILEQYKTDLDRVLIKRTEVTEDITRQAGELFRDGDMEAAQDLMEKGREASAAVRDTNRKYARQIEDALPEDRKPAWQDAVRRASFPQIYRPTLASRSLDAAAGFSDLDDAQKASIETLRASYQRDGGSVNQRLATAQEEAENTMTVMEIMRRRGGGDEGPMADLRRERRELDRATLENLRKILKPEQVERLPNNDDDGGGQRGGPRRGGQGGDRGGDRRGGGIG